MRGHRSRGPSRAASIPEGEAVHGSSEDLASLMQINASKDSAVSAARSTASARTGVSYALSLLSDSDSEDDPHPTSRPTRRVPEDARSHISNATSNVEAALSLLGSTDSDTDDELSGSHLRRGPVVPQRMQEQAAVAVQSAYKGFSTRKSLAEQRRAAAQIQAATRGRLTRRQVQHEHVAASQIQAVARGRRARAQRREMEEREVRRREEEVAAVRLQAVGRGYLTRAGKVVAPPSSPSPPPARAAAAPARPARGRVKDTTPQRRGAGSGKAPATQGKAGQREVRRRHSSDAAKGDDSSGRGARGRGGKREGEQEVPHYATPRRGAEERGAGLSRLTQGTKLSQQRRAEAARRRQAVARRKRPAWGTAAARQVVAAASRNQQAGTGRRSAQAQAQSRAESAGQGGGEGAMSAQQKAQLRLRQHAARQQQKRQAEAEAKAQRGRRGRGEQGQGSGSAAGAEHITATSRRPVRSSPAKPQRPAGSSRVPMASPNQKRVTRPAAKASPPKPSASRSPASKLAAAAASGGAPAKAGAGVGIGSITGTALRMRIAVLQRQLHEANKKLKQAHDDLAVAFGPPQKQTGAAAILSKWKRKALHPGSITEADARLRAITRSLEEEQKKVRGLEGLLQEERKNVDMLQKKLEASKKSKKSVTKQRVDDAQLISQLKHKVDDLKQKLRALQQDVREKDLRLNRHDDEARVHQGLIEELTQQRHEAEDEVVHLRREMATMRQELDTFKRKQAIQDSAKKREHYQRIQRGRKAAQQEAHNQQRLRAGTRVVRGARTRNRKMSNDMFATGKLVQLPRESHSLATPSHTSSSVSILDMT